MTRRERIGIGVLGFAVAFGLGYAVRARAGGIPATGALSYAGVIQNGSGPLTGSHTIDVSFLTTPSGGSTLCSASASVTVTNGYFSVPLPDTCTTAVGGNPTVWVDVTVDGADTGATKIGAVPYAVEGNHAVNADNATDAGTLGPAITSLQSSVSTLQGSTTSEGSSISTLQSSVSTLQSDMTTAQSNITTLQGDVTSINTSLIARPAAMDVALTGLTGSVNGTSKQLLVQAGTYVADADVGAAGVGNVVVPFKATFPNGLLTVVAVAGDQADGNLEIIAYDTTGFTVHADPVTGGDVRANWIAIGW